MLRSFAKGTCRRDRGREEREREREREKREARQREKKIDREKERADGKEEDAWSGQDRRANGGHRTEMASGSAFQYSTLATLGHPTSSVPLLLSSCSSASSAFLSFLCPHFILLRSLISLSFFLSAFLLLSFCLSRAVLSPVPIAVLLLHRDLIPLGPKLSILLWT